MKENIEERKLFIEAPVEVQEMSEDEAGSQDNATPRTTKLSNIEK